MNKLLLLLLSGSMYALASIGSFPCDYLILPAYILLFFVVFSKQLYFIDGFMWGILTYGFQLFPLFLSLYYIAGQSTLFIGWLLLTVYFALQSGFLFFLLHYAGFFLAGLISRIIAFPLLMTLYVWWIDSGALIIFDYWEGCCLFQPLVILARYKRLFFLLPYLGITGMTFLFFFMLAIIVACIISRSKLLLVFSVLLSGVWLLGFFSSSGCRDRPAWLDAIACIRTYYAPCQAVCLDDAIAELRDQLDVVNNERRYRLIITPESTVPCYINRDSAACDALCAALGETNLLLGAYRYDRRGVHNCCYWLKESGIASYVGKEHGMPFVERMPCLFNFAWLRAWFLSDADQFVAESDSHSFVLDDTTILRPLICSDLFLRGSCLQGEQPNTVFCALVNDSWFVGHIVAEHLVSVAWLRAVAQRVPLLYCSYTTCIFIDKYGTTWNL